MSVGGAPPLRRRSARADGWFLAAAALAGAAWFAVQLRGDSAAWLPLKGAPVLLLALWALVRRHAVADGGLLAAALACHAAGDLLLELHLLAGVGAFLLGHLLYIALFWRHRLAFDDVGGVEKLAQGALALLAAGFLLVLAPRLHGELALAIPVYAAVLTAMAGTAWMAARGRPWVPLGATLFVASDALLALELFAGGVAGGRRLVWPLYLAAQLSITSGWLRAGVAPAGDRHPRDA